jgi:uncharacterized protein (TIRG00374 family)
MKGVKFDDVLRHVREADPFWFVASVLAVTVTFPLRAVRWRVLLRSAAPTAPLKPFWDAVAIGFMANNVLPARAGELVRSYAGNRLIGVPFSTALASVAVERIFDGVIILLLLALGVASASFPPDTTIHGTSIAKIASSTAAIFIGALVVLILLARFRTTAEPLGDRLLRRMLPARLADKGIAIFHNLLAGLGVLNSTGDVIQVVAWSFAVWLCNGASYWLAFKAFHLDAPASAALVLQGVVALGVAIPAAPGFFGVFELLSRIVLGVYGIPGDRAASFAIAVHMGWFVPITVIGLIVLARTGLSLKDLRSGESPAVPTAS